MQADFDLHVQEQSGSWISESHDGLGITIKVTKEIFKGQSPYQKVALYETANLGKMLLLDDIIQFTEYDEFCYQEMMAHVPLFSHPNPERVLVIGGGDGGVLREIIKHNSVKHVDICEIDQLVVDLCKEHVPSLAVGYEDPRVNLFVGDGNEFVKDKDNFYDVIIVDSTDPIGPGESLFNEQFYCRMRQALRGGGVIASQSESIFLHPKVVQNLLRIAKKLFKNFDYAVMFVPTYPSGNIGMCVASLEGDVTKPCRQPDVELQAKLRYYSPEVHSAAFCLPCFGKRLVDEVKEEA